MGNTGILMSTENMALYCDGTAMFITISIPHHYGIAGMLAGEIYLRIHRRVREEKLGLRLEAYELEYWRRPVRLLYRVLEENEAEEIFRRVEEFFNEALLEVFSRPERLIELEMKTMELVTGRRKRGGNNAERGGD